MIPTSSLQCTSGPSEEEQSEGAESCFIPHHLVSQNGKNKIVFRCSFMYKGDNLNELLLLPGPSLSSSLLGVLVLGV